VKVDLAPDSLERLVPDELTEGDATGRETLALHVARYAFAARRLPPGRVLDLACGVGYGSRILAQESASPVSVLGVDVSPAAIAYARERYGGAGVAFAVADAMAFADAEGFDAIVSLETLEHLEDPAAFAARLARWLRPGGVLVASVPTTPSVDLNPHHRHDFSEASFRRLFRSLGLVEIDCLRQVQPVRPAAVLRRREARMGELRRGLPAWYARHPAALARRLAATLRYGFCNRYITIAWRSPGRSAPRESGCPTPDACC
jgi:SAM-dependent methyltransferase